MDAARIAALLEPFLEGCPTSRGFRDVGSGLSPAQLQQISTYIDLLLRWNARINLTAIRNPEEIVTRHFGESFFLARHLFPASVERTLLSAPAELLRPADPVSPDSVQESPAFPKPSPAANHQPLTTNHPPRLRVLDLGSGAGFPALPLKIWAPHIHLVLVESNHKKAAFLREVARALTLTNVDVFAERAETLSARLGPEFPRADVVTFRAVEKFDRTLPLAATFLAPAGRLALLISSPQLPKLKTLPTLTWRTTPIPQSATRVLSIGEQSQSGIVS